MMRKIGYFALSIYLLLAGLMGIIPNLLIPSLVMASLALIASVGIFLDTTCYKQCSCATKTTDS